MTTQPVTLLDRCNAPVQVVDHAWPRPKSIAACVGATKIITHLNWCLSEVERIVATGGKARVHYVEKGNVRLCEVVRPENECRIVEGEE